MSFLLITHVYTYVCILYVSMRTMMPSWFLTDPRLFCQVIAAANSNCQSSNSKSMILDKIISPGKFDSIQDINHCSLKHWVQACNVTIPSLHIWQNLGEKLLESRMLIMVVIGAPEIEQSWRRGKLQITPSWVLLSLWFRVHGHQWVSLEFSGSFWIIWDSYILLWWFCCSVTKCCDKWNDKFTKMFTKSLQKWLSTICLVGPCWFLKDFRAGEVEHHVGLTRTCQRPQFE